MKTQMNERLKIHREEGKKTGRKKEENERNRPKDRKHKRHRFSDSR